MAGCGYAGSPGHSGSGKTGTGGKIPALLYFSDYRYFVQLLSVYHAMHLPGTLFSSCTIACCPQKAPGLQAVCRLFSACGRCLTPVETKLPLEFSRVVYAPDMDIPKEEEDQQFVEEYELNLERLLEEELQLLWPTKTLCSEDCKGICMKCGQNRNEGSCDCDDFVPDIRFANLMDIFNGKK